MKQKKKRKITTKIILIDNLLYLLFGVIMYPLIPFLLNYPPNSIDNQFQLTVVGMQYSTQFVFIFVLGVLLNCITLYLFFKKLNSWEEFVDKKDINSILKVRKICADGIYKLIPTQVCINAIVLFIVFTAASTQFILTLKLSAIICIWTTVSDLLLYVFTEKIFNNILKSTYKSIDNEKDIISRTSVGKKMIMQYMSCILVIILVMSFYAYSRISYERGEFLKEKELNNLNYLIQDSGEENIIEDIKRYNYEWYFVLDTNGDEIYSYKPLNKFAKNYILYNSNGNRTYYQYGSAIEGIFKKINVGGIDYYIGKMFSVMPISYTITFFLFDMSLILLYFIIIRFFANNIKYQLSIISTGLSEIGSEKKAGEELAITSNDEFSDLVIAYNKVQVNNKEIIKELEEQQEVIIKQQQLVSIGELAGGVAHDINTPISAIKTGIMMLNEMGATRTQSEKEILTRMDNCATKIINIVNSMRNQIRNLGSDNNASFKISNVVNDVKIITYHEVAKNKTEVDVNIIDDVSIYGDSTKLGQVLTNLVVNASQQYKEKGDKIEVTVKKVENNAVITVKDYAGGIDESIRPYIFKNILTTKGIEGTGLGLYLAYSVIKGNFNGEMYFECEDGVGTTFYIVIPIK